MQRRAKTIVNDLLLTHSNMLTGYFFAEHAVTRQPVVVDDALIVNAADSLPLLDYLYDKEIQFAADLRPLFEQQQRGRTDDDDDDESVENYLTRVEQLINEGKYIGGLSDQQIRNLRTLYRFRIDNRLEDHSNHYQQSFLPFYRFSRHKSFSHAVGTTMKRNIRRLYDLVREIVGNDDACPCIILYNLFIRDNFRLFSLMSVQHCNYVRVYDDRTGKQTIVSYVELSNKYPQISKWFPNINSQYVKKHGPHSFQRLFCHVNFWLETSRLEGDSNGMDVSKLMRKKRKIPRDMASTAKRSAGCKRKKNIRDGAISSDGLKTAAARRVRLEQLFTRTDLVAPHIILDRLFRSRYIECKHSSVTRFYVQIRSGDESATVIVRCRLCGQRL